MADKTAREMEDFWSSSSERLGGYLYSICRDRGEAEDLLQECYLRAWRNWRQFRGEGSRMGWLFAIARRVAADSFRRRKISLINEAQALEVSVESNAHAEETEQVWHIINQLPQEYQGIIKLRFAGQLSYAEMAQVLEVPIGTVRSRLHRALKKIRERLDDED